MLEKNNSGGLFIGVKTTSVTDEIEIVEVNNDDILTVRIKTGDKKYFGSYLLMVLNKMRTLKNKRIFLLSKWGNYKM